MGFTAEFLLLYPKQERISDDPYRDLEDNISEQDLTSHPTSTHNIWVANETISFGHITRLEKVRNKERFGHLTFSHHRRAGICVISWILKNLPERAALTRNHFVPPFILYNDYTERRELLKNFVENVDYVDAGHYRPEDNYPKSLCRKMEGHNAILEKSDEEFTQYTRGQYHPVMHDLLLWQSCSTLATSLTEAETTKSEEWQELEKDSVSLALAKAWRAYLSEVGTVGVKALFLFP